MTTPSAGWTGKRTVWIATFIFLINENLSILNRNSIFKRILILVNFFSALNSGSRKLNPRLEEGKQKIYKS